MIDPHTLEYLLAVFGFLALVTRFRPQLMMLTVVFQFCVFLLQLLKAYKAEHPNTKISPRELMSEIFSHYFKTHPNGKILAKDSSVDEKVDKIIEENEPLG